MKLKKIATYLLNDFKKRIGNKKGSWGFIAYTVVTAAIAVAVEKVVQLATGQDINRYTIPIGPFSFQVGKGKPAFGFGLGIPETDIKVGVMAGKGRKPSWNIGYEIAEQKIEKSDLKIGVSGTHHWTGSDWEKGAVGVGVTVSKIDDSYKIPKDLKTGQKVEQRGKDWVVTDSKGAVVGKATKAQTTAWKLGLEGDYDFKDQKYGVELTGEKGEVLSGKVRLTKYKTGKPFITLSTAYKKDLAVGVTLGKGKPLWEFGTGIDVGKDFRVDFNASTIGSHLDNWKLGMTKYKIEEGAKKKQAEVTYKYLPDKKKGYFALDGKIPIPLSVDLSKDKEKRFTLDTGSIANWITNKMMPDPDAMTWQKKIDYALQEALIKGVKGINAGEMSPSMIKTLGELGFGGTKGIVFQKAVPDDYLNFARSLFPEERKGMTDWQVDMLKDRIRLGKPTDFPGIHEDYPSLFDYVEFPQDKKLLQQLESGEIGMKDFLLGRSFTKLDEAFAKIRDEARMAPPEERYISSLADTNPDELADSLYSAIKDSKTQKEIIEKLGPEEKRDWTKFLGNAWNEFSEMWSGLTYGGVRLPKTVWNTLFGKLFDPSIRKDLFTHDLSELVSEEQKMLLPAMKQITWGTATSVFNFFKDTLTAGPYTLDQISQAQYRGEWNKADMMNKANMEARFETLKNKFYHEPLSTINNFAMLVSPAMQAIRGFGNLAGFQQLASGATTATKAANAMMIASNPFAMLSTGLRSGISKIASTSLGQYFIDKVPQLKYRSDINKIYNEYKTARLLEQTKAQSAASNLIKDLVGFTSEEKFGIAKAASLARGENFAAVLPSHLAKNPLALKAAKDFRDVSDFNTLYALENKLLPIEQLEQRRFAPLIAEFEKRGRKGITVEQLRNEGFDPAYYPLFAEGTAMGAESTLGKIFSVFHKEKIKPYVGDLANVKKLDLSIATMEHQRILGSLTAMSKAVDDLKKLDYIKPYKPGEVISRGNSLIDIEGASKFFQKQGEFMDDYIRNMEILKNADEAMALTLERWNTPEKMIELRKAMPTEPRLYEIPTYAANILRSNFQPLTRWPIWDDFNDAVRDSVLAFRPAWIVNDFKNNAINYLISGRNPMNILEAMKKKYDPIFPTQLQNTGVAADMLFANPPKGLYGRLFTAGDKLTGGILSKFRSAMYALDKAQDNMFKKGFFLNDLERYSRKKVLEDTAKSYFLAESELRNLTYQQIERWAKNPAKYNATLGPVAEKIITGLNDWIYSYNNVWPLMTAGERAWLKRFMFFPEIGYWGIKKVALMPIKAPIQTALIRELARINSEWDEEKPRYLEGAEKIAENTFLRVLGGTIYDPEWGALNYQNLGQLSPALRTAVETLTGVDLRTGKPFSSISTPWEYNPETNAFEPLGKLRDVAEIDKDVIQAQEDLQGDMDYIQELLRAPEWNAREYEATKKEIDFLRRRVKELTLEKEATLDAQQLTLPAVTERVLRNFPQYQWLEDALVPFAKYGTFDWEEPDIIIDSKTGEPKYPVSRWMLGLRILGVPISYKDIEAWQATEATKEKRAISITFHELLRQLAKENPEALNQIIEGMRIGEIPFEHPDFPESPVFKTPPILGADLSLEAPVESREEFKKAVAEARAIDLNILKEDKEKALAIIEAISPEFAAKMRQGITALANEREAQMQQYYDSMLDDDVKARLYESIMGAQKIEEELKSLRDLPVDTYDISKQLIHKLKEEGLKVKGTISGLSEAMGKYLSDLISGNIDVSLDAMAETFADQVGVNIEDFMNATGSALANLFKMPADIVSKRAKDQWLRSTLEQAAFQQWKKDVLGRTTLPKEQLRLTPFLEQQVADDIMKYYSLGTIEPFELDYESITGEAELQTALDEIAERTRISLTDLEKVKEQMDKDLYGLTIKGIIDRSEQLQKTVKKKVAAKKRVTAMFTQERIAGAQDALTKAIQARRDFLGESSFASWQDFFDPQLMDPEAQAPLTTWLAALAGAQAEAKEKLGATAYNEFLQTDTGKAYIDFRDEMYNILKDLIPRATEIRDAIQDPARKAQYQSILDNLNQFAGAYEGFIKSPSISSFKDLYGLHQKSLSDQDKIPIVRFNEAKEPEAGFGIPTKWNKESFDVKFQELDKYSRTYASPEYRLYEKEVSKSYRLLERKFRQGGSQARFIGVLLQK